MSLSYRIAFALLAGSAGITGLVYAFARPTPHERMKAYRGPIGVLGRWAYFVTRPLLRVAVGLRLTANAISAAGAALALGAGGFAATGAWGWAGLLLVGSAWCDLIDGEVARATSTQGRAGAFLDSNLDRLGEIALFAGIARGLPDRSGTIWSMGALASSLMVSYARARGEGLGVACPSFGLERPHRVVLLMFAMLLAPFFTGPGGNLLVEVACAIVAVGATATALGRMVVIHRRLRREEGEPRSTARVDPAVESGAGDRETVRATRAS